MNDDLFKLLDCILWGIRIVEVDSRTFAFRPLTVAQRNIAEFIRKNTYSHARKQGAKTQNELLYDVIRSGLWSNQREEHIELLREELKNRQDEFDDTTQKSKQKKLEQRIVVIKEALNEYTDLRFKLIELPSAEYVAASEYAIYIVQCSTLSFPEMKQVWPTFADIQDADDPDLVHRLVAAHTSTLSTDIKHIRELARSGLWRTRWSAAKISGLDQLIHTPLSDLTHDQIMLLHWSHVYDSVYESIDRPPDYIIEDDAELDKWLDRKSKEAETERKQRFHSNKINRGIGKASANNANEILAPVDGFYSEECTCGAKKERRHRHDRSCPYGVFFYYNDKERINQEVGRVYEANPHEVRVLLAQEQKRLEGRGWVREEHLRNKMARQVLGFSTSVHNAGDKKR